jgi:hypothetical protein
MDLSILNLGAGVGSTAVYLLANEHAIPSYDAAIFADTQDEPAAVYAHLDWLRTLNGPPILTGTAGRLGDALIKGVERDGNGRKSGRFASIPAFTAPDHAERDGEPTGCEIGRLPRQCTREYKIDVVRSVIRRVLLGLKPCQRFPAGLCVRQSFGLTDDEGGRIRRVRERYRRIRWAVADFPLARLGMTRADCAAYLSERVPHEVQRSACVFCPYRSYAEWVSLRDTDSVGFARAVQVDQAIRDPQTLAARGLRKSLYLVRSCEPLAQCDLDFHAAQEARRARGKTPDMFSLFETPCTSGICGV